jgi:hypothetical protein
MTDYTTVINNIDLVNQVLYIGGNLGVTTKLAKLDLNTFTQVGTPLLLTLRRKMVMGVLDLANSKAYYAGLFYDPTGTKVAWAVVKVDLLTFTETAIIYGVGSIVNTFTSDIGYNSSSIMLDAVGGFVYVTTEDNTVSTTPMSLLKIDLSTFGLVSELTIPGVYNVSQGVIDVANGYVYFVEQASPAKVHQVELATFSHIGFITLNAGENITNVSGKGRGNPLNATNSIFYVTGDSTTAGRMISIGTTSGGPFSGAKVLNRKTSPYNFGQILYSKGADKCRDSYPHS